MIIHEIAQTHVSHMTITALDYEPKVFTPVKGVYDSLHIFNGDGSGWFA